MSWLLLAVPRLGALAWAVSSCGSSRVAVALHGAAGALVVGVVEKSVVDDGQNHKCCGLK